MNKCSKCSSNNIDTGRIVSAGAVGYQSNKHKNPFTAGRCITYACLDCGYSETYIEKEYLDKARGWQNRIE